MSYNSNATIYVTNNTKGNAYISFSHQYSSDSVQTWTSPDKIAPGANAGPLSVGFNTGTFYTGQDYWFCGVNVVDGPRAGQYSIEGSLDSPEKKCTMETSDNGATLTFSVTTSNFVISENSGSCSSGMSEQSAILAIAAKTPKKFTGQQDSRGRK